MHEFHSRYDIDKDDDASSLQLDTYHPTFNKHDKQRSQKSPKSGSVLSRVLGFGKKKESLGAQKLQEINTLTPALQIIPALSLTSVSEPSTSFNRNYNELKRHTKLANKSNTMNQPTYLADYMNQRDLQANGLNKYNEDDDDDEDDEGEEGGWFFNAPSNSANTIVYNHRNATNGLQEPPMSSYEDWLDDRQGMNSGEFQELRTKGEQLALVAATPRPSLDGSIISNLATNSKNNNINGSNNYKNNNSKLLSKKSHKKSAKLRSKSPSGLGQLRNSAASSRYSQKQGRGLLQLASRLRLTKKHDSIARLQLTMLQSGLISLKKLDRDLQTFLPSGRMNLKELKKHVELIRKYPILAQIEYRFASRYETYVCRHAQQEANLIKNNYKRCIPYDYNRVVLRTIPNLSNSDYINASYVDSCLKPNAYIAAQGPNEHTLEDFWRMIWEQRSFVLVMLTKVFDFIKVMCNQYWPIEVNKTERHGNIEVTLLYEEPLADFVIRTIRLTYHKQSNSSNIPITPNVTTANTQITAPITNENLELDLNLSEEDEDQEDDESNQIVILDETKNKNNCVREPKFRTIKSAKNKATTSNIPNEQQEIIPNIKQSQRPPPIDIAQATSQRQHNANSGPISAGNQLTAPRSPLRPDTPSSVSLGGPSSLERNSSTRRAVKKRRKPQQAKRIDQQGNSRPTRTQFQVPDESDLISDDSGQEDNGDFQQQQQPKERIVYQFHYHNWASHTVPFIGSLLHFRRRVRICADQMAKSGKIGPTVVHCNDGCGRTGAYLCIDANLELADEDGVYDVFNYTKKLRQSRKLLIENLDQYKFVYDVLEESLFCGKTWFNVSELHQKLKHKSHRNATSKKNEYQIEYEKICRMTSRFSIGDCAGGHRVENREKNRDVSTVPPDYFRPYLTSFQTNDSTDYINAVFVDGYTRSKEYIVTEWPLHRTMSDFWSLVYDHDCNSVILLANPPESSTYPSFLPTEKELRRKFGPVFSAEMVSYTHYQNIKSWIYTINKKIVSLTEVIAGVKSETKTTQVFQITCWPQAHRVPTSTNALVELMNMVERWRQRTTYGPVCVVSLDGKSRAGVYCAANVAIEQVVQHGEVDVFQAVKTVRRHRPQLIENMTEYKYCYDLILHYVLHYLNQSSSHNQTTN